MSATISVRLSEADAANLKAAAASEGVTISEFVRRSCSLAPVQQERIGELEHRLARVEQVAGLE